MKLSKYEKNSRECQMCSNMSLFENRGNSPKLSTIGSEQDLSSFGEKRELYQNENYNFNKLGLFMFMIVGLMMVVSTINNQNNAKNIGKEQLHIQQQSINNSQIQQINNHQGVDENIPPANKQLMNSNMYSKSIMKYEKTSLQKKVILIK